MIFSQSPPRFRRVATSIALFVADTVVDDDEIHSLTAAADAQIARGDGVRRDQTGTSCEVPVEGNDPVLETLRRRIAEAFGFENAQGATMRFRRYRPGEFHPLHVDEFQIDGDDLVATAMLWLSDTGAGGETVFPAALPAPLLLEPRRGRLAVWLNYHPDGTVDTAAMHEAAPVLRGEKVTLTAFLYAKAGTVPAFAAGLTPEENVPGVRTRPVASLVQNSEFQEKPGAGGRFVCVNDDVPAITVALLRDACERLGVAYVEVETSGFSFLDTPPLAPGDMLYRPAVSAAAMRVEQHLWVPGVATFHTEPDGMFFSPFNAHGLFARAGVPIPRTFPVMSADRPTLRALVRAVGGFPVILKVPGWSRGIGTVRVGGFAELFSVADYMLAQGSSPLLCQYIDRAEHWRITVIGDQAVACYRNIMEEDDFRTYGSEDPADFPAQTPPALAAVAIAAVRACRMEFGGVDVLEAPDGRLYVLESNYPCYFGQAQVVAGVDVAGAMVGHLRAKAMAMEMKRHGIVSCS